MNLFPYRATMPDGTEYRHVRVVWDGETTRVWHYERPSFVIVAEADEPPADDGQQLRLSTPAGVVTLAEDSGCGCGHPLKRHTPQATSGTARRVHTVPKG